MGREGLMVMSLAPCFKGGAAKSHGSCFANACFAKLKRDLVAPVLKQTGPLEHGKRCSWKQDIRRLGLVISQGKG